MDNGGRRKAETLGGEVTAVTFRDLDLLSFINSFRKVLFREDTTWSVD